MNSDGDRAEVLIAAAPRLDLAREEERAALAAALADIGSDADLTRALAAFARRDLGPEGLAMVLEVAGREIASDGDLASLLVEVASHHRLDGELDERYRAAAATLQSEGDRRRALAAR